MPPSMPPSPAAPLPPRPPCPRCGARLGRLATEERPEASADYYCGCCGLIVSIAPPAG